MRASRSVTLAVAVAVAGAAACAPAPARLPTDTAGLKRLVEEERAADPAALLRRSCALWRLGQRERAAREARLSLVMAPRWAAAHLRVALMEQALGNAGAATVLAERAQRLDPDMPGARAALARLLLQRADQRTDPVIGLLQIQAAEADLGRAAALAPALNGEACRLGARIKRLKDQLADPVARGRLIARGGDPFRGTVACPGPPRGLGLDLGPLKAAPRCTLARPGRFLDRVRRRYALVGCAGAQLAVRLERWGCLDAAAAVWSALADEAPADPRWPLQQARILLARGSLDRAAPLLTSHVYLAADRQAAMLTAAEVQLQAGDRAGAGRRATMALDLARTPAAAAAAVALLRRAGFEQEAEQAARRAGFNARQTPRR